MKRELGRDAKVLAWVIYHMEELKDAGFVSGGEYQMTRAGRNEIEGLMADGFEPTREEMRWALSNLNGDHYATH